MTDHVIERITENVNRLEHAQQTTGDAFLGVSCLTEAQNAKLKDLGWRATYDEKGFYLLSKL